MEVYGGVGLRRRARPAELERRSDLHELLALHLLRRPFQQKIEYMDN